MRSRLRRRLQVLLSKEFRERLANEYRYAATRMQQEAHPAKKLFYFSIFFGEAQRILNLEWDRDLALIYMVTQQTYTQINPTTQAPIFSLLPIQGATVYEQLTKTASDLAMYAEKEEKKSSKEELCQILGRLAELSYAVSGNGSYLHEKGLIKF
jgi:hypothetical protein